MIPIILLQEQWTCNRPNSSQKTTKSNWPTTYMHTYIATLWHPSNADYLSPGFLSSLVGTSTRLRCSQNSVSFPSSTQQPPRAHAAGRHTVTDTSSGLVHYPLPLQHTPHSDPLFLSYIDTGCTWPSYLEPEEKHTWNKPWYEKLLLTNLQRSQENCTQNTVMSPIFLQEHTDRSGNSSDITY